MKTPDEIKKGLYICYVQPGGRTCGICPYDVISEDYCECNLSDCETVHIQQWYADLYHVADDETEDEYGK